MKSKHNLMLAVFASMSMVGSCPLVAFGQQQSTAQQSDVNVVTGEVYDSDGEPLPGVSVVVDGFAGVGVATDMNGKFTLKNIPAKAKSITISYIGMKSQTPQIRSIVV